MKGSRRDYTAETNFWAYKTPQFGNRNKSDRLGDSGWIRIRNVPHPVTSDISYIFIDFVVPYSSWGGFFGGVFL
jgi:hypothetical protein